MNAPTKFKIHVKENGEIFTTPPSDRVPRNGEIEWTCDNDYHFALSLGYNSPCEKEQDCAGPGGTITAQVRPDAPYGEYKYVVAVFKDGKLLIEDPRFIVRR